MQSYKKLVVGKVELDPDFPLRVAERFTSLFADAFVRNEANLCGLRDAYTSIVYYKAARQLFSTMTSEEQSMLWSFKKIICDETQIPPQVADALSIIGHFDIDCGRVQVENAVHLFQLWVWRAYNLHNSKIPIWKDEQSLKYARRVVTDYYNSLAEKPVELERNRVLVSVRPLPYACPRGNTWSIDYLSGKTYECAKGCVSFLDNCNTGLEEATFQRYVYALPSDLGLTFGPSLDQATHTMMQADRLNMWDKLQQNLSRRFTCGPAPYTRSGRAAQLMMVDPSNPESSYSCIELPEKDQELGWIYTPAKKVELESRVQYFSNQTKARAATLVLSKDKEVNDSKKRTK